MSQHMPKKVLMYSADVLGLGHLRRQLKIATFLQAEVSDLSILLLTGSALVHAFPLPPGIDCVKFPSVLKTDEGMYDSQYLSLPVDQVKHLRERIILETALAYQPDLLLVDYHPAGVDGELLSTLQALHEGGRRTAVVLGFRDIEQDPQRTRARWQARGIMRLVEELYDEIWVYGCQALFDPIKEYEFPERIARKIRFCGYLGVEPPARPPETVRRELGIGDRAFVLVTTGAGRDGLPLLDAYLNALDFLPEDLAVFSLLLTGPDLPAQEQDILRLRCRKEDRNHPTRNVMVVEFSPSILDYMAAADVVVSMGGYNTLAEVLAFEKRAVVIPRFYRTRTNSLEQLVRASLFERLGLIRMLHPEQLSPELMAEALLAALHGPPPSKQRLQAVGLDLNGLHQVKTHVVRLLRERSVLPGATR